MSRWIADHDIEILFVTVMVLFVACIVGIYPLSAFSAHQACQDLQAIDQEHEYRWTFWTGCRVKIGGYWVDYDRALPLLGE